MICRELQNSQFSRVSVEFSRYRSPISIGRTLISGWFRRAQEMKDCQGAACFEAFFYTWIAFNGWAVCITDDDRDAAYIDALLRNDRLCQEFSMFTADSVSPLALASAQFASFCPIFSVRELRHLDVSVRPRASREDTIRYYLNNRHIQSFAPKCATKHRENGEPIPIDWSHTLVALYQVRCNFFHGGKMISSEEDQQIVASAYRTLLFFLEQGHYIL